MTVPLVIDISANVVNYATSSNSLFLLDWFLFFENRYLPLVTLI